MKTEEGLSKQGFQPPTSNAGDANRDVIISYLQAGGIGIELTAKQKELLERWSWCDEKMRENVGKLKREAIANLLKHKYGINRSTAFQDIVNTEFVFSTSTPLNKKYRIQIRIEFLENEIRQASIAGKFIEVAMLEKVLQKYLLEYPDVTPTQTPNTWLFNVNSTTIVNNVVPVKEAETYIDLKMKEYTEFEELDVDDLETDEEENNEH